MINLFRSLKKQRGLATLLIATMMLMSATMTVLFSASNIVMKEKTSSNQYRGNQAYSAAEAGLEYGISYLSANRNTIIPGTGSTFTYTNGAITNVSLSDGSKFTITYSNPVSNDFSLIRVSAVGTSADGKSTRTVTQLLKSNMPATPVVTKGSVALEDDALITNNSSNTSIKAGGTVKLSNDSKVRGRGCQSTKNSNCGNYIASDNSLLKTAQPNVFNAMFNMSMDQMIDQADYIVTNINYYNDSTEDQKVLYSSRSSKLTKAVSQADLAGKSTVILMAKKGKKITEDPFDQSDGDNDAPDAERFTIGKKFTIFDLFAYFGWGDYFTNLFNNNNNTVIGSPTDPALVIVYAKLTMNKNATVYGYVYVVNDAEVRLTDDAKIVGGIFTAGRLKMDDNAQVIYDPNVLSLTPLTSNYAKVPGTWSDY